MTRTELQIRLELHQRELRALERIKVGCRSCEHYSMPECLKFQQNPPPDIVQQGCDEWTYDHIPF